MVVGARTGDAELEGLAWRAVKNEKTQGVTLIIV